MTQLQKARRGEKSPELLEVASKEELSPEALCSLVASGQAVILKNMVHEGVKVVGIGHSLKTKVNANLGTSPDLCNIEGEMEKLRAALEAGADTIMDLSIMGPLDYIRRQFLEGCPVPLGTVPIYQAARKALDGGSSITSMSPESILQTIEEHARDGVDFMTIHCGLTRQGLEHIKKEGRVTKVVSRGGAFLAEWMLFNEQENPCYEHFDEILSIAQRYDVTLSLGDGLRPGCLADASDRGQLQELIVLGELADRAREAGVQVIIEGPGHMPLDHIKAHILLEKRICKGAPFYLLGPLVTDVAPGYDHITGAIGGALAASYGADFLCYVTPSEHLRLPEAEDVREGVIASRIAAHVGDLEKGIAGAWQWDLQMAQKRMARDWKAQIELAIDPKKASSLSHATQPHGNDVCTMCGNLCSMKKMEPLL